MGVRELFLLALFHFDAEENYLGLPNEQRKNNNNTELNNLPHFNGTLNRQLWGSLIWAGENIPNRTTLPQPLLIAEMFTCQWVRRRVGCSFVMSQWSNLLSLEIRANNQYIIRNRYVCVWICKLRSPNSRFGAYPTAFRTQWTKACIRTFFIFHYEYSIAIFFKWFSLPAQEIQLWIGSAMSDNI